MCGKVARIEYLDTPPLNGNQAGLDQALQDARKGFRLNAEFGGHQPFRYIQIDHAGAGVLRLKEKAHHSVMGVGQGQVVDFIEPLVQADAQAGQQRQAEFWLLGKQAQVRRVLHTEQQAALQRGGTERVVRYAVEQQGLGEGITGAMTSTSFSWPSLLIRCSLICPLSRI